MRNSVELHALFLQWLLIGIQSFGGGSATFFLIHQKSQKNNWLTNEEFLNAWALAQLTPGINLIKITIFIGKRLRGWKGIVAATSGLMIPSALVTGLMSAGYAFLQKMPEVEAVMRGILPATIGMALAMTIRMASPTLKLAYQEGRVRFIFQLILIIAAAVLMASQVISPVLIMLFTGMFAILAYNFTHQKVTPKEDM